MGSLRSLECRQFFFNQRRSGSLPARLYTSEQVALEAIFVAYEALEVRIIRIRFRNQIKQVEGATGSRRQVSGDGGDNTSGRAGDQKNGVLVQRQTRLAIGRGLFLQPNGPAQSCLVADL